MSGKGTWDSRTSKVSISSASNTLVLERRGAKFRVETILPNIGVPKSKFRDIVKFLGATLNRSTNTYSVSCSILDEGTTNLVFEISGVAFPVPPSAYINQDPDTLACTLNLSEQSEWIFGQTFLSKYYSVYDATNRKIGFASYA